MTQRHDQTQHERMIYAVAMHLDSSGFSDIKADAEGYEQPDKVWWESEGHDFYIPDLTANKNSTTYYFEVETYDTISGKETLEQWKLFSAHANHINGKFIVVVSKDHVSDARQQIDKSGIDVDEIWDIEI